MPEGAKQTQVETLRQEVGAAIDSATKHLRKIETLAQQSLNESTVEQQHLDNFLDELHYRLQFLSNAPTEDQRRADSLSASQLQNLQKQEQTLIERRQELKKTNSELDQLSTRLTWLIHQIEGACAWVLNNGEGEAESGSGPSQAGEQVMWAQIVMGQEAERARLAREIHDGPAQALANMVMRLQVVEQMFTRQPDQVEGELVRLRTTVQDSLQDVRRFIFNLRPASLSDVGLVTTLKHYTHDYSEQYGVPVELSVPDTLEISQEHELVVFRIVQEALQNIHKHSNAKEVSVDLQQRPGGPLVVTITDNGQGFNPQQVRQRQPSSSGLVNMRERAATVGGTLQIESKPGTGAVITLVLPMPKV